MPRGAKASPPCGRPVCRRCGTQRGRIAHATLFSGTRPRCRTRQEWKYTGTRDGRLTRWSALARFGAPEMRPCGRVAHYMDTFPEVTPFIRFGGNRGHLAHGDRPGRTGRHHARAVPPRDVERDRAALGRREPRTTRHPGKHRRPRATQRSRQRETHDDGPAQVSRRAGPPSMTSVPVHDSLRAHRSRGVRGCRKVRSMAGSMSSATCSGRFAAHLARPAVDIPACEKNRLYETEQIHGSPTRHSARRHHA